MARIPRILFYRGRFDLRGRFATGLHMQPRVFTRTIDPTGRCRAPSSMTSTGSWIRHRSTRTHSRKHVCVCIHIYIHIYIYIYTHTHIYLPVCLSIYLSIYLSICLSVYLSIYLSICISMYLCIHLSSHLSACVFLAPTWHSPKTPHSRSVVSRKAEHSRK